MEYQGVSNFNTAVCIALEAFLDRHRVDMQSEKIKQTKKHLALRRHLVFQVSRMKPTFVLWQAPHSEVGTLQETRGEKKLEPVWTLNVKHVTLLSYSIQTRKSHIISHLNTVTGYTKLHRWNEKQYCQNNPLDCVKYSAAVIIFRSHVKTSAEVFCPVLLPKSMQELNQSQTNFCLNIDVFDAARLTHTVVSKLPKTFT